MKNINRRRFIKAASLAAGFPCIVPRSALAGRGVAAPSDRIVMGCIGVGGMGTNNMKAFLEREDVRVVAVCDVDRKHRDEARAIVNEKYGSNECHAYDDFRLLLGDRSIDAVTVCTPDHWHGLISIAAAKAGKDIYCEKPLTNTIAEGRALCKAARRQGRILQTGSHERSRDNVRFACELVRSGKIGELETIEVNLPCNDPHHLKVMEDRDPHPEMPVPDGFDYDMWLGPAPLAPYTESRCHFWWRFIMAYGGGEMTDRGAHIIDIAQLGNDSDDSGPVELRARGERPQSGLFDTFMNFEFECRYANGVRMVGSSRPPRGLKFIGSEGWIFIHIHGGKLEAEPVSLLDEKPESLTVQLGRSPGHRENFLEAIRTRKGLMAPGEVGHRTATICHLLNISMLTSRALRWDPAKEKVSGDREANRMRARKMRKPWHL